MIRGSIYEENVQVKRYALEKGEKTTLDIGEKRD